MTSKNPENTIYITYKTRMTAEAKIRRKSLILNVLISWYSFCLIVLSVNDISRVFDIAYSQFLSVTISIALFGVSLFVYGERYHESAAKFRDCYLELQSLYRSTQKTETKMARYHEILRNYNNHSDRDYDDMRFDAWFRGKTLDDAEGRLELSILTGCKVVALRLAVILIYSIFFFLPFIVPVALSN